MRKKIENEIRDAIRLKAIDPNEPDYVGEALQYFIDTYREIRDEKITLAQVESVVRDVFINAGFSSTTVLAAIHAELEGFEKFWSTVDQIMDDVSQATKNLVIETFQKFQPQIDAGTIDLYDLIHYMSAAFSLTVGGEQNMRAILSILKQADLIDKDFNLPYTY